MYQLLFIILVSGILFPSFTLAQSAAINSDGSNADASAMLDVKSTNKGMLVPRMTTAQRTAIASPAKGLLVFDNDTGDFWFYNGTAWTSLSSGQSTQYWAPNGNNISNTNTGSVGIGTATPSSRAILHLNSTTQGLFLPSLNNAQMNAIGGTTAAGLMIYNNEVKSPMIYTQRGYAQIISGTFSATNAWTPISPGPRMLAWGIVDSSGGSLDNVTQTIDIMSGSGNFSVLWNATDRWFELKMTNINFELDSMLLIVTPIGNGTWDQAVSVSELSPIGGVVSASIKFADISRVAESGTIPYSRRRSKFNFVLYSLRRDPF